MGSFRAAGLITDTQESRAYLSPSRADWAEGRSEPERFIVAGDNIIVFVHARVWLKDSTEWNDTPPG